MTDNDSMSITDGRNAIIEKVLEEQKAYEDRRATMMGQGAERLTAPLSGWIARMIPATAMRAALRGADRAAKLTLPAELIGHDLSDLAACDRVALRVQAWSQGTSAASGGLAGWFGGAGLAVDIPATIGLAARNVRATGAAYGFTEDSPEERAFRLMVLEVATSMASGRRKESLKNLNDLAAALATPEARYVLSKGGDWLTDKLVERIARQLGLSLASRKAGQLVPIIGGAVAAVVNASFQVDVARAARYAYRQRWLMQRKLLPAPEPAPDKDKTA